MKRYGLAIIMSAALAAGALYGCSSSAASSATASSGTSSTTVASTATTTAATSATSATTSVSSGSALETADLFTDRDLEQSADTSSATEIAVTSGNNVTISNEGVYVLSGSASDVTITVEADSSAKVQLVLDDLTIANATAPVIYVASADKVFVTTAAGSTNSLSVTGAFAASSDDSSPDGVIFAKDDLVLNGAGTLQIKSSDNGIVGKDDVKVTGGTYQITAAGHGIEGKDSVAIAGGTFTIDATTDAIHSENSDDATRGFIYIAGGTFTLTAGSDGIEAATVVQVDGGDISIKAAEGISATYVQLNDGTIAIAASDDGINATNKSTAYNVMLQINGGTVSVTMGSGDTDALDSNGDLYINGGTVDITAQFAFDFDGTGQLNGGTVTVNGEQITEITNSMMGGGAGGMGGMGGQRGGAQGGMR